MMHREMFEGGSPGLWTMNLAILRCNLAGLSQCNHRDTPADSG